MRPRVDDQCFVNQRHAGSVPCDVEALWSPPEPAMIDDSPEVTDEADDPDETVDPPATSCPR